MSHDPKDEQREDAEPDVSAADGEHPDLDPEPDFELHGQFFNSPTE
jgi:hypothetical protein